MKKKLLQLPEQKLKDIALSFSISGKDKKRIATELTEYLKSYGLRWADLVARFNLPK